MRRDPDINEMYSPEPAPNLIEQARTWNGTGSASDTAELLLDLADALEAAEIKKKQWRLTADEQSTWLRWCRERLAAAEAALGHATVSGEEMTLPCQEPERSSLVDGEWWSVLDRAERAEARVAELEVERDALADALRKYGEHRRDCLHRYLRTCDCGFSAALDPNRDTRP